MAVGNSELPIDEKPLPSTGSKGLPLVVFADDWGRHPSSCQHLVSRLLPGHRTFWINTVGTRKPRFDLDTLRRGMEKLRHWTRPKAKQEVLPANLQVLNPRMWPSFDSRFARWLNRRLLTSSVAAAARETGELPVAVSTIPLVADLVNGALARRWVYYCVDDFTTWPGLDGDTLRRMEEEFVQRADVLISVSETLQQRLAAMGRSSHLLTHGVDTGFWSTPETGVTVPIPEGLERPLVVFWGVVDRRMDTAFLTRLAKVMDRGTVVLAGPEADPDPALSSLPRLIRTGALPFASLPALAREAAVLIMPYADLPVTRAIQPLKLKEYLATGKPVVVRDLPATRPWADCLDLANTAEEFTAAVSRRLTDGLPQQQQLSRARLAGEGWDEKALAFERWLFEA
jgi:glycosyltransferase involved in cell wall biosynthesis